MKNDDFFEGVKVVLNGIVVTILLLVINFLFSQYINRELYYIVEKEAFKLTDYVFYVFIVLGIIMSVFLVILGFLKLVICVKNGVPRKHQKIQCRRE